MEDKNKELQLNEEEAENVSGGIGQLAGESQKITGALTLADEEQDNDSYAAFIFEC